MMTTFFAVFIFGIYCVRRFCIQKRPILVGQQQQTEIRSQARKVALSQAYDSSDGGYSGSEFDYSSQNESCYQTDNEISIDMGAEYH